MKTVEWLARLDTARSREEVLLVLHAYVNCWSSYDRAQLPESCRISPDPLKIDLDALARNVARELESFDLDRTRERLLKVLDIFTARAKACVKRVEQGVPAIEAPLPVPVYSFMKPGPGSVLPVRSMR